MNRTHAIVMGGSMAGLLAARALSDHFASVTVIEADHYPSVVDNRKGVPQGRHAHGLLASGFEVMESFFPGLADNLVARGATRGDIAKDVIWCLAGSYKHRFECGLGGVVLSRPLLETTIRERTAALPNVELRTGQRVKGLTATDGRITGVDVEGEESGPSMTADLVVDATGRGSRTPSWLEGLGFPAPEEETVDIGVSYTTRVFRRRPEDFDGLNGMICGIDPPRQTRFGVALGMEGDRWMVTLGGFLGDHAPVEDAGYLAFAETLAAPDLARVLRHAEPLSEYVTHKFPSNRRRRYERLDRFPEGYLVVGDGVCSFNPIYGQGMSVAACEARELAACLAEGDDGRVSWRRFFERIVPIIDIAWTLAASADLAVDGVTGKKPAGFGLVNWYLGRLQNVAARDAEVCRAFFMVTNLLAAPETLFAPRIALKVLAPGAGRRPTMSTAS